MLLKSFSCKSLLLLLQTALFISCSGEYEGIEQDVAQIEIFSGKYDLQEIPQFFATPVRDNVAVTFEVLGSIGSSSPLSQLSHKDQTSKFSSASATQAVNPLDSQYTNLGVDVSRSSFQSGCEEYLGNENYRAQAYELSGAFDSKSGKALYPMLNAEMAIYRPYQLWCAITKGRVDELKTQVNHDEQTGVYSYSSDSTDGSVSAVSWKVDAGKGNSEVQVSYQGVGKLDKYRLDYHSNNKLQKTSVAMLVQNPMRKQVSTTGAYVDYYQVQIDQSGRSSVSSSLDYKANRYTRTVEMNFVLLYSQVDNAKVYRLSCKFEGLDDQSELRFRKSGVLANGFIDVLFSKKSGTEGVRSCEDIIYLSGNKHASASLLRADAGLLGGDDEKPARGKKVAWKPAKDDSDADGINFSDADASFVLSAEEQVELEDNFDDLVSIGDDSQFDIAKNKIIPGLEKKAEKDDSPSKPKGEQVQIDNKSAQYFNYKVLDKSVFLSWSPVENAFNYTIVRSVNGGQKETLWPDKNSLSYFDSEIPDLENTSNGVAEVSYTLMTAHTNRRSAGGFPTDAKKIEVLIPIDSSTSETGEVSSSSPLRPTNFTAEVDDDKIRLFWKAVDPADGYILTRVRDGELKSYNPVHSVEYTDTIWKPVIGEKIHYFLQAYLKNVDNSSNAISQAVTIADPEQVISRSLLPAPTQLSAILSDRNIDVEWNKVDGASAYQLLLLSDSGEYNQSIRMPADSVQSERFYYSFFNPDDFASGGKFRVEISGVSDLEVEGHKSVTKKLSIPSLEVQVVPDPTNILVRHVERRGQNEIFVASWDPVPNAESYSVEIYADVHNEEEKNKKKKYSRSGSISDTYYEFNLDDFESGDETNIEFSVSSTVASKKSHKITYILPFSFGSITHINDTGITLALASNADGILSECDNSSGYQDCAQGRDVHAPVSADVVGAFEYLKKAADGTTLPVEDTSSEWSCVEDKVTGLTWEVKSDRVSSDHFAGQVYKLGHEDIAASVEAANLEGLCGEADWRVPTVKELQSLIHYGEQSPAIASSLFPNTQTSSYLSSSRHPDEDYWVVDFDIGKIVKKSKDTETVIGTHALRLVRGGVTSELHCPSAYDEYIDNPQSDTVVHTATQLEWKRCPLGYEYQQNDNSCQLIGAAPSTWTDTLNSVQQAHSSAGWRVPNVRELNSIMRHGCTSPLAQDIFPFGAIDLWSSSPAFYSTDKNQSTKNTVWHVNTEDAKVSFSDKNDYKNVLLVR